MTKDERLLITLCEIAHSLGDIYTPVSIHTLSEKLKFSEKVIRPMIKQLIQVNFIRRQGEEKVYVTDHCLSVFEKELSHLL